MKLLLDENLSPRLVGMLGDLFPGSVHVHDVGLGGDYHPFLLAAGCDSKIRFWA